MVRGANSRRHDSYQFEARVGLLQPDGPQMLKAAVGSARVAVIGARYGCPCRFDDQSTGRVAVMHNYIQAVEDEGADVGGIPAGLALDDAWSVCAARVVVATQVAIEPAYLLVRPSLNRAFSGRLGWGRRSRRRRSGRWLAWEPRLRASGLVSRRWRTSRWRCTRRCSQPSRGCPRSPLLSWK